MTDVFISYSKLDRVHAERLAADLKWRGLDVWWDADLYASQDYPAAILQAIDLSKIAIAIWSSNAVKSDWVRDEANRAHQDRKLIPTHIPPFDLRNVPLGLGNLQSVDINRREELYSTIRRFGLTVHDPAISRYPFAIDASKPLVQQVEETRANLPPGLEENWSLVEEAMGVLEAIEEESPHYAGPIARIRKALPYAFYIRDDNATVSLTLLNLRMKDDINSDHKLILHNVYDALMYVTKDERLT